jgi:hypothetical protein
MKRFAGFLDRIEEHLAVILVDEVECLLPKGCLPKGAKEGDYLTFTVDIDANASQAAQKRVESLIADLSRNDTDEDCEL